MSFLYKDQATDNIQLGYVHQVAFPSPLAVMDGFSLLPALTESQHRVFMKWLVGLKVQHKARKTITND